MSLEISLDQEADALYIKFRERKFSKNKKIGKDIILDLGTKGELIGIEILNVSKKFSQKEIKSKFSKIIKDAKTGSIVEVAKINYVPRLD